MGVDGRILVGDGILINSNHLPEEWLEFLVKMSEKYPDLFEYDYMSGITRDWVILVWARPPTILFPVNTVDRRPLILRNSSQLELMKPMLTESPSINLDDKQIWNPSYENFAIQLNDYYQQKDYIRQLTIDHIRQNQYKLGEEYEEQLSQEQKEMKFSLDLTELENLSFLLRNEAYTLVGQWMIYNLS